MYNVWVEGWSAPYYQGVTYSNAEFYCKQLKKMGYRAFIARYVVDF